MTSSSLMHPLEAMLFPSRLLWAAWSLVPCLLGALLGALASIAASPAVAQSNRLSIAMPAAALEKTIEANTHLPLLEHVDDEDAPGASLRPALGDDLVHRSAFIERLTPAAEQRSWTLVPRPGVGDATFRALVGCLSPAGGAVAPWPAAALFATGLRVSIVQRAGTIELGFDRPVGVLPALLEGCLMPNAPPAAWGPFVEIGPARLAADVRSRRGRPAIEWVEFQPGDVNADLWTGTRPRREARIQYAARPDVIVLLGAGRARERVPIELDGPEQHARFRSALRLPVLLDALWGGEGAVTGQLLPAPAEGPRAARRAPSAESFPAGAASRGGPPSVARPLRIPWLEGRAPVLPVHVPADDELVLATGERVALWLRAHGLRSEARPFRDEEEAVGMRLVRFRPESRDLALSLLAFAGRHTSLRSQGAKAVLQNPRLLSASIVQRRLAAEALERAWLQGSEAIPLMTVAYWLAMDPAVRGVRLREDGVPLLESAHWRGR